MYGDSVCANVMFAFGNQCLFVLVVGLVLLSFVAVDFLACVRCSVDHCMD